MVTDVIMITIILESPLVASNSCVEFSLVSSLGSLLMGPLLPAKLSPASYPVPKVPISLSCRAVQPCSRSLPTMAAQCSRGDVRFGVYYQ